MNDCPQSPDTATPTWLHRGDRAAEASDWVAAVSSWEAALTTTDRERAEARLQWFLATAATPSHPSHHRLLSRGTMIGVGAAIIGTSLVLFAERISSPMNGALIVVAWILFTVAAVCSILFAYQHRPNPRPLLTPAGIKRARELARQVDRASATMPTGPRLPA